MRFLTLSILSVVFFFSTFSAHALDGIPKSFKLGGTDLTLNGEGSRNKFVFTIYHAGLYIKEKNNNASEIISANEPMVIRLKIKSGFASKENMKKALIDGFKNATNGNTAPIQTQINQVTLAAFTSEVSEGDIFDLAYTPSNGGVTQVLKNGKFMSVMRGLPFKKALFGIWLSDKPAQKNLRAKLLGK